MDFDDRSDFETGLTLNIDADTIVYAVSCVYTEDTDHDREMMSRMMRTRIGRLQTAAEADEVVCFLTTRTNFRDKLVNDYKANRASTERPVNLAWGKQWLTKNYTCIYLDQMEADDLLGIHSVENTIIWSLDKDLRQIPGLHLDEATQRVRTVTEEGTLVKNGKKYYFDGMIGFYFQLLTGDTADYIIGCGKREECVYKSGAKAGETYRKRIGIGPGKAFTILTEAEDAYGEVLNQYQLLHGDDWITELETQANLLWMVRKMVDNNIKRWTYDSREEWMDVQTGEIT